MGVCGTCCKVLLYFWTVLGVLYSIGILGLMLFRVARDGKDDADKEPQAGNPVFFDPVMDKVLGDGLYNFSATTVINNLSYVFIGAAALSLMAFIIHLVSACKKNKCLFFLSTVLIVVALGGCITALVFYHQIISSMETFLRPNLNQTIIEFYGTDDDVTRAWDLIGKQERCCGVDSGEDFLLAKNWNGTIKAGIPPCGTKTEGCYETIRKYYLHLHDIWLSAILGSFIFILFISLIHTSCVCRHAGKDKDDNATVQSYSLQRKR